MLRCAATNTAVNVIYTELRLVLASRVSVELQYLDVEFPPCVSVWAPWQMSRNNVVRSN